MNLEAFSQKICPPSFLAEVVAGPSTLKDSDILIYSLLAVCLALLFSSLFLAFVAFLRGKAKTSNQGSTQGSQSKKKKESEARLGQETGIPAGQLGKSSKG